MASEINSIELDAETVDLLEARSRETGESPSCLLRRLVREAMRMERHPGIVFRDGPAGRRAALIGGPDVWELVPEIQDVNIDDDAEIEAAARRLELPGSRIRAALDYY